MARCQDTSPSSVLTRRHEEQRLIIYKQTPERLVWLHTSAAAFHVTPDESILFSFIPPKRCWKNHMHDSVLNSFLHLFGFCCFSAAILLRMQAEHTHLNHAARSRPGRSVNTLSPFQRVCTLGAAPGSSGQPSPRLHPILMPSLLQTDLQIHFLIGGRCLRSVLE